MKKKIVIKLQMKDAKCRSKAMQTAVDADGVTKVEIQKDKDEMVVIGEEVETIRLTKSLRKKFQYADIVSVQEEKEKKEEEKKKEETVTLTPLPAISYHPYPIYEAYDPYQTSFCTIL
ncbi:heavy metal-associated isoprenylated plant protein 47-like [Pistacia vera]|uniref:heavy metal-associated isoprenylated plant protein 47-like n=1 Tax=Pistacia vera TaxID=55513 RepID=UPI001263D03B|nr:heavy metal-associated isoprenylated plant protein 47-like [Pistacia vera]